MEIFLDHLHEDLNRVDRSKKIIPDPLPKPEDEMLDQELADAKWKQHLKYNNSFIVDLFYGQLKSHLQCSVCAKNSLTFDPFVFLSVPLPKPQITLTVFFFSLDYSKKPSKVSITTNQDSKCLILLQTISEKFKVKLDNLRLMVINNRNEQFIGLDKQVSYCENSDIFIFEIKIEEDENDPVFYFLIRQCRLNTSKVSYLNVENTTDPNYWSFADWSLNDGQNLISSSLLGKSFIISLKKSELTFKNLCIILKQRARHSVDINVFELKFSEDLKEEEEKKSSLESVEQQKQQDNELLDDKNYEQEEDETIIKLKKPLILDKKEVSYIRKVETNLDDSNEINFNIIKFDRTSPRKQITNDLDLEELISNINNNNNNNDNLSSSNQLEAISLLMQWVDDKDSNFRIRVNSKDLDHSANYLELLNQCNDKNVITLEDCLKMFTDKEELSKEDFWHCPECKKPQQATKRLTIWQLPKILIIQLKRFSYKQFTRDKIDHFIDFPLHDLDLKEFCSESNRDKLEGNTVYDLYAVINHYGGILGGHYTATAKTTFNNEELGWRLFDDYSVDNISENQIVTNNAYILFYRLKNQVNGNMETE